MEASDTSVHAYMALIKRNQTHRMHNKSCIAIVECPMVSIANKYQ